jgi:hypothetical protein
MAGGGWNARTIAAVVAIAVGLLLLAEWAWVTDTERIEARLGELGDALVARDVDATTAVFSKQFTLKGLTWDHLHWAAQRASKEGVVKRLDVRSLDVTFGRAGTAESAVVFNATAKRNDGGLPGTAGVTFGWTREDDDVWRITTITSVEHSDFFFQFFNTKEPLWAYLKRYARQFTKK